MKNFIGAAIFLFFSFLSTDILSQITCVSKIDMPLIQQANPTRHQRILSLEQHTQNYINAINNQAFPARLVNPNSTIIIPVVVHILHRGEQVGVGRNISDAQILSQIAVLNEDFRRLNADRVNTPVAFQPVAGDPNFEFRLACIDPSGNFTNGITRTFAGVNQFQPLNNLNPDGSVNEQGARIKFTVRGGRDAWPTDRYLNIWVCDMGGGLIGYGQFPDEYTVKPTTDGVVLLFDAFGRVGNLQPGLNQGRVCVHEIGHWLNLRHIWGDANCGNDLVDDTPTQEAANRNCPGFPNLTCNNGPNGDMFMNYMDYTDNACQNIYTRGQNLRMRAVFAQGGPRAGFINNYFRINVPNTSVCNLGTITASNPNCLPITWTILSGPASINSGQGTNTISLQVNGNGMVRVTASAGGIYIDEINFRVGSPDAPVLGPSNFDWQCGTFFESYCTRPEFTDSYLWNLNFGQVVQENQGYYGNYLYTAPLINSPTQGFEYFNFVTVQARNACGLSAPSETLQFTVGPISSNCGGGGGGPILLRVSPNPTSGNLTVETMDNTQFNKLRIIDKFGNVKKLLSFSLIKKKTISIVDLSSDVYQVQVFISNNWRATSFIKQ